jgi:hypothetical protein
MSKLKPWVLWQTAALMLCLAACAPAPPAPKTATPTPTSSSQPPVQAVTPTPTQKLLPGQGTLTTTVCDVQGAEIEVQLYLPYAAEADLDPIAAGTIPLSVSTGQEPYTVQGTGHISYDQMQTWTDEEGKETAEVFLELDVSLEGVCSEGASSGVLHLTLDAVHQEEQGSAICAYPPGECRYSPVMGPQEQSFDIELPLKDGSSTQREDWTTWTFVVHLQGQ